MDRAISGNRVEDTHLLREYVDRFATHPNQLIYKDKVLVTTFAGQDCLFGCSSLEEGWACVKAALEDITPVGRTPSTMTGPELIIIVHQVHLIPSFFIDPRRYPSFSTMDGYFNVSGPRPLNIQISLLNSLSGMEVGRSTSDPTPPDEKWSSRSLTRIGITSTISADARSWQLSLLGSSQFVDSLFLYERTFL